MSAQTTIGTDARPARLMQPLMKMPLVLYRLHLGWLMGHRFLRLTHVGRKSGMARHTVLAVLHFDPQSREVIAISAWTASEWYKNIQVRPALEVETGHDRFVPQQRALNAEEIALAINLFCNQNPIISRIFCRIPGWEYPDTETKLQKLAHRLKGVAFRPRDQ